MNECLTDDELNSFLTNQYPSAEQEKIEGHLSRCQACRRRLVSLYEHSRRDHVAVRVPGWARTRVLKIPGNRRAIIPSLILSVRRHAATAATTAVIIMLGAIGYLLMSESGPDRQPAPIDLLRQDAGVVPAPQRLAPPSNAVIASDRIEFRWSRVPHVTRYTLTLLDEKGDIVFHTSTREERLTLSASSIHVERGIPYFWYVEATLSDGTAVDSDVGTFMVRER